MLRLSTAQLETRIVHQAEGILVIDKPAGLPTSGRTLADPDCLQHHLIERAGRMIWAVHQLDADTSGLNVFATRKSLVAKWAKRLRWPVGRKLYAAICHGEPQFETVLVEEPIGELSPRRLGITPAGKQAASHVQCLCRASGYCLMLVELRTGRTHQARIHLAHLGHPLVGEPFYRDPPCERLPRHALHALRLELDGDEPLSLHAPLPQDLEGLCRQLGLDPSRLQPAGAWVAPFPAERTPH